MKLTPVDNNLVKSPKGYAPAGRLYPEIWVKFLFLVPIPYPCTDLVKFGVEESTFGLHLPHCWLLNVKFHPNRCIVSPLSTEKP